MGKPHMTSPNFGEIFRSIYQMVAVQKGAPNLRKITLKELKLMKNNYANKSTDKRIVFSFRGYTSPMIILESFYLGQKLHNIKEKGVLKSKENPERKFFKLLAKF